MAIDVNELITPERRQEIINQRVTAWAEDLFSHTLNKEAILAEDPAADTAIPDAAIAALSKAIENAQAKGVEIETEIAAIAEAKVTAEREFAQGLAEPAVG